MGRAGYVLAGGRSSRMGTDKALLPYRGLTLIEHAAARVRRAAGSVSIVGPPARYRHLGFRTVADLYPGAGPLAGIHAALTDSADDWNLVLACDLPAVPDEFLSLLLAHAEASGADCSVPLTDGLRPQPLCAVYHRRCASRAAAALAAGRRKMTAWLEELRVEWLPAAEPGWFVNANTPEDWRSHLRELNPRSPEGA